MKTCLTLAALLVLGGCRQEAESDDRWPVSAEARQRSNPVAATGDSVERGAESYRLHCLICHGEHGRGDGPWAERMPVPMPDFTNRRWQAGATDGEIFWKLSQGREMMPAFERFLSEEQRWHVVNYLRSLQRRGA